MYTLTALLAKSNGSVSENKQLPRMFEHNTLIKLLPFLETNCRCLSCFLTFRLCVLLPR